MSLQNIGHTSLFPIFQEPLSVVYCSGKDYFRNLPLFGEWRLFPVNESSPYDFMLATNRKVSYDVIFCLTLTFLLLKIYFILHLGGRLHFCCYNQELQLLFLGMCYLGWRPGLCLHCLRYLPEDNTLVSLTQLVNLS